MKKLMSFFLFVIMVLSLCPMAFATGYSTSVTYTGDGTSEYEITVPAALSPGSSGNVLVEGTWPSDMVVKVFADKSVTLTNDIDGSTKVLSVDFDGISQVGNNTESISVSESVSVASISNALYGTWEGTFCYNVISFENTEVYYTYDVDISNSGLTAYVTNDGTVHVCLNEESEEYSDTLYWMNYVRQVYATFDNESTYAGSDLPVTFNFDIGSNLMYEFEYVGDGEYTIAGSFTEPAPEFSYEPATQKPIIITITRNSSNVRPGGSEDTESPIYFGEFYGGGFTEDGTEIYILGMLNEDGSMGMMYLENGVIVGEGEVEAGTLSYSGLNVINVESGEIIATVSADGKSMVFEGLELTLQETGVQYGESYWTSIELDGSTEYGIWTFYEDGSTEILSIDTDGVETELLGEPTGSYRYDGVLIYGEDELVGFAFDNGTKLFTGGLVFVLGEPDIDIGSTYSSTFADNSWEDIIAACEADEVPSTWSVGDTKAMTINGTEYNIQIIGKNHDTYSDGSGTAPLTFQLVEEYGTKYQMNSSNDNTTGWSGSAMRTTHLNTILSAMPSEVQSAIKAVDKSTLNGAKSGLETTSDKLFLLSEIEVFGSTSYSNGHSEGSQYAFYANGGSTIKNFEGSAAYWWLRGPCCSNSNGFSGVINYGSLGNYIASGISGVAFGFCF